MKNLPFLIKVVIPQLLLLLKLYVVLKGEVPVVVVVLDLALPVIPEATLVSEVKLHGVVLDENIAGLDVTRLLALEPLLRHRKEHLVRLQQRTFILYRHHLIRCRLRLEEVPFDLKEVLL